MGQAGGKPSGLGDAKRHWRWHRAYGGGQIMDWIGHHNDIAHWGIGMEESGPLRVEAVDFTWPETEVYNTPGHLAYVSVELGRALEWDPVKEEVVGDIEAQRKLTALPYREPWKL